MKRLFTLPSCLYFWYHSNMQGVSLGMGVTLACSGLLKDSIAPTTKCRGAPSPHFSLSLPPKDKRSGLLPAFRKAGLLKVLAS